MSLRHLAHIVLMVGTIALVSSLMCQWPHCETQKCEPVTNCSGTYQDYGAGFCGCCPACLTYSGEITNVKCLLITDEKGQVKQITKYFLTSLQQNKSSTNMPRFKIINIFALGVNGPCEWKDVVDAIVYPATSLCEDGLQCDKNTSTCKSVPLVGQRQCNAFHRH